MEKDKPKSIKEALNQVKLNEQTAQEARDRLEAQARQRAERRNQRSQELGGISPEERASRLATTGQVVSALTGLPGAIRAGAAVAGLAAGSRALPAPASRLALTGPAAKVPPPAGATPTPPSVVRIPQPSGTTGGTTASASPPAAAAPSVPSVVSRLPSASKPSTPSAPASPTVTAAAGGRGGVGGGTTGGTTGGITGGARPPTINVRPNPSAAARGVPNSTIVANNEPTPVKTTPVPEPRPTETFGQAFRRARNEVGGGTGRFTYGGKEFQTNIRGTGTSTTPQERYVTQSQQTTVNRPDLAPRTTANTTVANTAPTSAPIPTPRPNNQTNNQDRLLGTDYESGSNKKGKKKMSESTLIKAFLELQEKKSGNMFEAAKKMAKKDHDQDGKIESGKDEYLGSKIRAVKAAGKLKEETQSSKSVAKEEVKFSEEELAHFEAVLEAMPVDQGKTQQTRLVQVKRDRSLGDTVPTRNLTDEYIDEEETPAGPKKRGRKPGVKVGSYKIKGMDDVEDDPFKSEVKNVAAQVRTTRSKDGKTVSLVHPETRKTHSVAVYHVEKFNRDYSNAERAADKQKIEKDFISKHMNG